MKDSIGGCQKGEYQMRVILKGIPKQMEGGWKRWNPWGSLGEHGGAKGRVVLQKRE